MVVIESVIKLLTEVLTQTKFNYQPTKKIRVQLEKTTNAQ